MFRPRSICACSVWPHATSAARTLEVLCKVTFRTLRYTQSRTIMTFCSFLESSGHERQTTVGNSVCVVLPCRRMDRRMFRSVSRARCLFRPRSICACSVWPARDLCCPHAQGGYALRPVRARGSGPAAHEFGLRVYLRHPITGACRRDPLGSDGGALWFGCFQIQNNIRPYLDSSSRS